MVGWEGGCGCGDKSTSSSSKVGWTGIGGSTVGFGCDGQVKNAISSESSSPAKSIQETLKSSRVISKIENSIWNCLKIDTQAISKLDLLNLRQM